MTQQPTNPLDEAWDRTEVRTVSPNEQVFVTVRGDREIAVAFAPGYYERASRHQLAEQLERTAKLAFADRTRAFFSLLSRDREDIISPSRAIHTPQDAEYWRRLDMMEATGSSADGSVSGLLLGNQHLTVTIEPGVLDRLDATAFAAAASEAATRLLADHLEKAKALRFEVYYADLIR